MSQDPLSDTDYVLLDRFFAGETSAAESAAVHALLARCPEVDERVQAIVRGVRGLMPDTPQARRSWEMVAGDGLVYQATHRHSPDRRVSMGATNVRSMLRGSGGLGTRTLRRWVWPALAAGAVIAATAWNVEVRYFSQRGASSTLTYTTGNGQRANITLPDGSTAALNVASRLEVPADYAVGHHTVRLTGEALFTVTRREAMPFTVISGSATARVLGTSFVVRHYPGDSVATVAVRDGKVSVRSIVLTAERQVEISRTGMMHVSRVDPSRFSFATGVLTFDGVPLRDAIVMLDRWFDADIRLGDATLGTQKVAGGFTAGSLSNLTESLELMFNVRVVQDGRVLTVYPR